MIKLSDPSQEHPASSIAPNQDIKDMDILQTFKIRIESRILMIVIAKTSSHIQIKTKIPKQSQEPPVPTKAPNKDSKA